MSFNKFTIGCLKRALRLTKDIKVFDRSLHAMLTYALMSVRYQCKNKQYLSNVEMRQDYCVIRISGHVHITVHRNGNVVLSDYTHSMNIPTKCDTHSDIKHACIITGIIFIFICLMGLLGGLG